MMLRHRKLHARIWTALAMLLPLVVLVAALLSQRMDPPAPVRLAPAEARP